jgi:hypothetical protein
VDVSNIVRVWDLEEKLWPERSHSKGSPDYSLVVSHRNESAHEAESKASRALHYNNNKSRILSTGFIPSRAYRPLLDFQAFCLCFRPCAPICGV